MTNYPLIPTMSNRLKTEGVKYLISNLEINKSKRFCILSAQVQILRKLSLSYVGWFSLEYHTKSIYTLTRISENPKPKECKHKTPLASAKEKVAASFFDADEFYKQYAY